MSDIDAIKKRRDMFNVWPINTAHETCVQHACKDANQGAKDRIYLLTKVAELEAQLQKIDELLFGTDEPLEQPVNIEGLNELFRKLQTALQQPKP